jgi:hypothetical protein
VCGEAKWVGRSHLFWVFWFLRVKYYFHPYI